METQITETRDGIFKPTERWQFIGAKRGEHSLHTDDDTSWGKMFTYRQNFGPWMPISAIVRAQTWEDALETVYDVLPTIPESDLWEAYGFDSEEEYQKAVEKSQQDETEWPELAEGYYHQANCSGTGIVNPGECENLSETTLQELIAENITLQFRDEYDETVTLVFGE